MAINATCHTMVYLAAHNCWIGMRTNLKTSNAIIVHVIPVIVTLKESKTNNQYLISVYPVYITETAANQNTVKPYNTCWHYTQSSYCALHKLSHCIGHYIFYCIIQNSYATPSRCILWKTPQVTCIVFRLRNAGLCKVQCNTI